MFARLVFAREYANTKSRLVLPLDSPYARTFQRLVNDGYAPDRVHRPHMAEWQSLIEKTLHTPLWNVSVSFPKSDRLCHAAKQIYDDGKKNLAGFMHNNILVTTISSWLARYKFEYMFVVVFFVFLVVGLMKALNTSMSDFEEKQRVQPVQQEQIPRKTRLIQRPVTLSGFILQESKLLYCVFHWGRQKISIDADGKMGGRRIKVETLPLSGGFSTHMLIESGMVYRWNNTNHKGEKYPVATQEVKEYLDQFQVNTVTKCEYRSRLPWHEFKYKFELPKNIDF